MRAAFLLSYCSNLIHLNVFGIVSVLEADTRPFRRGLAVATIVLTKDRIGPVLPPAPVREALIVYPIQADFTPDQKPDFRGCLAFSSAVKATWSID